MSDLPISYSSEEINGWLLWHLQGRLLTDCQKLALDLSALSYLSSAGIRTLLRLADGARQAGKPFAVISPGGMVREILEMARLDMFVTIHPSAEELKNA